MTKKTKEMTKKDQISRKKEFERQKRWKMKDE